MSKDKEESFEDAFDDFANNETDNENDNSITHEPESEIETDNESLSDEIDDESRDDDLTEDQPRDDQGRFTSEIEKYKQEAQLWQHRYNSDLGRQQALQRKIQEQQAMISDFEKRPKSATPEGAGLSQNEWATLQEDFPEIASAMEARITAVDQMYAEKIARLEQQIQPIQQQSQEHYRNAQFQILDNQHPDWRDIAQSNEFRQWVQSQPSAVQQLMTSDEAADAAYLVNSYKLHQGPGSNDELKQRRQKQLHQGQTISNRGGRSKSNLPPEDDYSAAFDYFASR